MKDEFIKYLNAIGITTQPLLKRIETVYEICSVICPDEIVDIFVEDYIKEDGTREYQHLDFFSEKYIIGVSDFLIKSEFNIKKLKKNVNNYKIKTNDYDFNKATEKSRLDLESFIEGGDVRWTLKASKENCDFLKDIIFKYFRSNLKD